MAARKLESMFALLSVLHCFSSISLLVVSAPDPEDGRRVEDALEMLTSRSFPSDMFNRCALVGSSPNLVGQKRGQEIDSHDTVIRVNRVPTSEYYEDFGRKVDVYFMRPNHIIGDRFNAILMGRGVQERCKWSGKERHGICSDIRSIVLGGHVDGRTFLKYEETSAFRWEDLLSAMNKGKFPKFPKDSIPIASQVKESALSTHLFRTLFRKEPSTGFHGILLFATVCRSLDLYGFGGSGTADGHQMWDGHPIHEEHKLVEKIIAGTVNYGDFTNTKAQKSQAFKWLQEHLDDFKKRSHIRHCSEGGCAPLLDDEACPSSEDEARKATLTLQPGKIGITIDDSTGEISAIEKGSQARSLGLEIGMYVLSVNDERYSRDTLKKYAMGKDAYKIVTVSKVGHAEACSAVPKRAKAEEGTSARKTTASSNTTDSRASKLESVVTMHSKGTLPSSTFNQCALVGTAKHLLDKAWGQEIDAFDTVIRVNRLPKKEHFASVGRRTEVYFVRHNHAREDGFNGIMLGNGEQTLCSYHARRTPCNISMLVMGGGVSKSAFYQYLRDSNAFRWEDLRLPPMRDKTLNFPQSDPLLVSSQSKDIAFAAHMLQPYNSKEPSVALHALMTFLPICGSLHLYGFEDDERGLIERLIATPPELAEMYGKRAGHTVAFRWLESRLSLFRDVTLRVVPP